MSRGRTWSLAPEIVSRRIAGEHLLVPVRHGAAQMDFIYTVNTTGSLICDLLSEARSEDDLVAAVGTAYGIPAARARADVDLFLQTLREAGLARAEDPIP